MTEQENRSKKWWIIGGGVAIVVILLLILFWPKETYTSDGGQTTKVVALDCKITHTEEAFFKSEAAQRYTHEIRATFKNNTFDEIAYVLELTYNSPEVVEAENARLHANYNIYMSDNGQEQGLLKPIFSNIKSKLKVLLYGDKNKLNDATSKLFFLDASEAKNIGKNSIEQLERLYEKKGFSCSRSE